MKCVIFGHGTTSEAPFTAIIKTVQRKKMMQHYETLKMENRHLDEIEIELYKGKLLFISKHQDCNYLMPSSLDSYCFTHILVNENSEEKPQLNKQIQQIFDLSTKIRESQMVAGTVAQMNALMQCPEKGDYKKECEFLTLKGILKDKNFEYGKGWLYKPHTLNFTKELHKIIPEKYWS